MNYSMEELIPIVAELAEKYTSKESSSIPYSKAQQLMGAVIYCIQVYEAGGAHDSEILAAGVKPDAEQIYQAGYQLVLKKLRDAQNEYSQILTDFNAYGNRAYADTFDAGMRSFFMYYDARFQPQDHLLTLDYPVLCPLEHLRGIQRIEQYIRCVGLEQEFLRRIPQSYIYGVLRGHHSGYEDLFINLAGVVNRNIQGSRIAGHRMDLQGYSEAEKERLIRFVEMRNEDELEAALNLGIEALAAAGEYENPGVAEYLQMDMHNFSYELKHAVKYQCLEQVLVM